MTNPDSRMNNTADSTFSATQLVQPPSAGLGRPRRVRQFLNISTVLLIVLGLMWAVFAWYIGQTALLLCDLALIAIGLIALAMQRASLLFATVHWLLIALLFWVVAVAYFVSGSGVNHNGAVHYWLIVYIVGVHFILFDSARIVQTFYIATAILLFIVIEYGLVPLSPRYGFPNHDTLFSHGLTLGLVLIAISVMTRAYITALADAERASRDANIRSHQLLRSVLPSSVLQRVQKSGETYTERAESCTILFADIVGFTALSSKLPADELVALLNQVFSRFDALAEIHGVEKIKTIGDGYMAASGIPAPANDHAHRILNFAIDMLTVMEEFPNLSIRVGINTGPAVAGIIGRSRIAFDLWGEAVNIASRMESQGETGRIQVTEATAELTLGDYRFDEGHIIDVKGKGEMYTRFLLSKAVIP